MVSVERISLEGEIFHDSSEVLRFIRPKSLFLLHYARGLTRRLSPTQFLLFLPVGLDTAT